VEAAFDPEAAVVVDAGAAVVAVAPDGVGLKFKACDEFVELVCPVEAVEA
jgi:hypothetical protein